MISTSRFFARELDKINVLLTNCMMRFTGKYIINYFFFGNLYILQMNIEVNFIVKNKLEFKNIKIRNLTLNAKLKTDLNQSSTSIILTLSYLYLNLKRGVYILLHHKQKKSRKVILPKI